MNHYLTHHFIHNTQGGLAPTLGSLGDSLVSCSALCCTAVSVGEDTDPLTEWQKPKPWIEWRSHQHHLMLYRVRVVLIDWLSYCLFSSFGSMSLVSKYFFMRAIRVGWTRETNTFFPASSNVVAWASGFRTDVNPSSNFSATQNHVTVRCFATLCKDCMLKGKCLA